MALPPLLVDPKIWREIAGPFVQFPTVRSRVYYLPQGHCEEATSPPILSPLVLTKPSIPCIVTSVQYLADPNTDEIFAKLTLQPVPSHPTAVPNPNRRGIDNDIISFAKIITSSDAYRISAFLIPKHLAESIFPPLQPKYYDPMFTNPPLTFRAYGQRLTITDMQGMTWDFDHIYRLDNSTHFIVFHQFHLGLFSYAKNPVPGDTLIFMKNSRTGKLFIGIRRHKKGKVSPESVAEAAELAANDMQFEVVYYPNPSVGWTDFVVKAELMQERMSIQWCIGMRVWIPLETGETGKHGNRITIYLGTVSYKLSIATGPWPNSPWRMLEITWDEQMPWNFKWLCPWQVNPSISPPPRI